MIYNPNDTIAFMGVEGANADLACRQSEPYMETMPCASFEDVFDAVRMGKARLGMLPIENSQAGRVAEIHQILPESGLHIVGEYFLRVNYVLAGTSNSSLDSIKEVYSHPQALMQCRNKIREMGLVANIHSNTAVAARDVRDWGDNSKVAICSKLAAELYGLRVLDEKMQDSDNNITVFVKMAKEPLEIEELEGEEHILTSLLFTLRNIPAGLYKALGGFATNNVNLLKLESYIPGGVSQTAQFFITLEGHPEQQNVSLALEELNFFTKKVNVLGIYPASSERSLANI